MTGSTEPVGSLYVYTPAIPHMTKSHYTGDAARTTVDGDSAVARRNWHFSGEPRSFAVFARLESQRVEVSQLCCRPLLLDLESTTSLLVVATPARRLRPRV
jgi:hypothetical protein